VVAQGEGTGGGEGNQCAYNSKPLSPVETKILTEMLLDSTNKPGVSRRTFWISIGSHFVFSAIRMLYEK